jgi:DNA-binding NtrC family response regulator
MSDQPAVPASILVIDDEPDVLAMLRTMLLGAGFDVTVASNAKDAIERLAFTEPACIVTDIYMADGDGFELMNALRRRGSAVPVIVISGGGTIAHDLAQKLGAAAVLAKPFRSKELVETVNRVVGGDQAEIEHGNGHDVG